MHIYARAVSISNVVGRADYVSNPDRQENLLAVAGIQDKAYWRELAKDCKAARLQAGGDKGRRPREAREIHVELPRKILDMSQDERQRLAENISAFFRDRYGADNIVGLHESKTDGNVHVHVLFPERQRLLEPEIRIADRNVFLDERGVRRRTKKEIFDADGQLRPGCKIIPKGEILSSRHFGPADPIFGEKDWLHDCKQDLCDWINQELQPDKLRTVFDPAGPYLAQVKIGKGGPADREARIRQYNKAVQRFNALVESGRIPLQTAIEIKEQVMLSPHRAQALKAAISSAAGLGIKDEIDQGGIRTAAGPNEDKKRRLRELHRQAAEYRRLGREAGDAAARKIFFAEARKCSAQIDRLRMELGYLKDADYERLRRKIEEDLKRRREWTLRTRERVARLGRSWRSVHEARRDAIWEKMNLPVIRTKAVRERERELDELIAGLEIRKREILQAEAAAKQQMREARRAYREAKRQAREQRQELRQSQQRSKANAGPER